MTRKPYYMIRKGRDEPSIVVTKKESNIGISRSVSTGSKPSDPKVKQMFTKTNYMGGTEIISHGHTKDVTKNKQKKG